VNVALPPPSTGATAFAHAPVASSEYIATVAPLGTGTVSVTTSATRENAIIAHH